MSITFDIKKTLISVPTEKGMNLELNYMSWNKGQPKYDIRKWDENHETMSKGITMTRDEAINFLSECQQALDIICGTEKADIKEEKELPF